MKKIIILFLLITIFVLTGCSKSSLTSAQKDLSKDAIKLEYKDATKENPSMGNVKKGKAADILLIERGEHDYTYLVCFKGLKSYKDISVYLDGDKLKIFYEEDNSGKSGDTWIIGQVNKKIDVNDILIYKNNRIVRFGIGRNFGVE
jgi:hypothetical protein